MEKSEEVAKNLISREGKVKGEVIRTNIEYLRRKRGDGAVERVQRRMKELGSTLDFNNIKPFHWYSEGENSLIVVVAKEVLNWSDNDVYEMGYSTLKLSFIMKMILQYFVSAERVFKNANKYWRKHFDVGSIELVEFSKKEKYASIRIKDFYMHRLNCVYQKGFFQALCELVIKSKEVNVEEVRCIHRGDSFHEYKITWI